MDLGTVSTASMIGMGVSGLLAIGLPVFLMFYVKFRYKGQINFFFIGAAMFVVSAMMLEQLCHAFVFGVTKGTIQNNIWVYALYAGLAAAVFEETGRLIAIRYFMNGKKVKMNDVNAFMYGIGHGGAESVLIVGSTCVNNLTTAIMLNSGSFSDILSSLDDTTKQQTIEGIKQLVEAPFTAFYLAGIERIFAIAMQIAFTVLIYQAVKHQKKELAVIAYAAHFVVDFITVVASNFLPMISTECLIAAMAAAMGVGAYFVWQKYDARVREDN